MESVVGWVLVVVGSGVLLAAYVNVRDANRSRRWPVAVAQITRSEVQEIEATDRGSHRFVVEYRFSVGGVPFTGQRLRFTPTDESLRASEELAARYPHGSSATVAYDPADPRTSVLEPAGGRGLVWLPLAGLVFLGAGIAVLVGLR